MQGHAKAFLLAASFSDFLAWSTKIGMGDAIHHGGTEDIERKESEIFTEGYKGNEGGCSFLESLAPLGLSMNLIIRASCLGWWQRHLRRARPHPGPLPQERENGRQV